MRNIETQEDGEAERKMRREKDKEKERRRWKTRRKWRRREKEREDAVREEGLLGEGEGCSEDAIIRFDHRHSEIHAKYIGT